jgi:hypothetical protein
MTYLRAISESGVQSAVRAVERAIAGRWDARDDGLLESAIRNLRDPEVVSFNAGAGAYVLQSFLSHLEVARQDPKKFCNPNAASALLVGLAVQKYRYRPATTAAELAIQESASSQNLVVFGDEDDGLEEALEYLAPDLAPVFRDPCMHVSCLPVTLGGECTVTVEPELVAALCDKLLQCEPQFRNNAIMRLLRLLEYVRADDDLRLSCSDE